MGGVGRTDGRFAARPGAVDDVGDAGGWEQLPDPPLTPRNEGLSAWTGHEIVVVGGWEFTCADLADCVPPEGPPRSDGAAFDPATGSWRPIADAPHGLRGSEAVAVDGDVYLLPGCTSPCAGSGLLRYRPADDEWDTFASPPESGRLLAAINGEVVVFSGSDESGEVPDWRFDVASESWVELPDDPLPATFDRQLVGNDDDLLLFAKPIEPHGAGLPSVLAARLDATTRTWTILPAADTSGFQAWAVDDVVVINPHFRNARGGIYHPATQDWRPLPAGPDDEDWRGDMAGVLGTDHAEYAYPDGSVLDVAAGTWVEIPALAGRHESIGQRDQTAVGRDLFVFGGERRSDTGENQLINEAWLWHAP